MSKTAIISSTTKDKQQERTLGCTLLGQVIKPQMSQRTALSCTLRGQDIQLQASQQRGQHSENFSSLILGSLQRE